MMKGLGSRKKASLIIGITVVFILGFLCFPGMSRVTTWLRGRLSPTVKEEVSTHVTMEHGDARPTEDGVAFGVYAASAGTYEIQASIQELGSGELQINRSMPITIEQEALSVTLAQGVNVLYFSDCEVENIKWSVEEENLAPMNKICMLLYGDANLDGERTVIDLVRAKKEATVPGSGQIRRMEVFDFQKDGNKTAVDGNDVDELRKLLVGNAEIQEEIYGLVADAYIEENDTIYDAFGDAVAAASELSIQQNANIVVTVFAPAKVSLCEKIDLIGGAQVTLTDDGWVRTILRDAAGIKMFRVGGNSTLTLCGSSASDVNPTLILDGQNKAGNGNHMIDVGMDNNNPNANLVMNKGVKLIHNYNSGSTSSGGAIVVRKDDIFQMNGGEISGNKAKGTGGAINLLTGSTMNMADGMITGNETGNETGGAGAINVSAGAKLIMTGGTISGNTAPISVDNNSVRLGGTNSILKLGGAAYIDRICIQSLGTPVEVTSELTTADAMTLYYYNPISTGNQVVLKGDAPLAGNIEKFTLSGRMLPCAMEISPSDAKKALLISGADTLPVITANRVYGYNAGFDSTWAVQGVCTDGQYLYTAIEKETTVGVTYEGCKIVKISLADYTVSRVGPVINTDHSNELTYDSKNNRIVVTHCLSSGAADVTSEDGPYTLSFVDPDNLQVTGTMTLDKNVTYSGTSGIYAVAYSAAKNAYVAGCNGFRFGFLDDTLKEGTVSSTGLSGFAGYTAFTKQGVYANGTTIFANTWDSAGHRNYITRYGWDGTYQGSYYVKDESGADNFALEGESMFEYHGAFYMACIPANHIGVEIYRLNGMENIPSNVEVYDGNNNLTGGYDTLSEAIEAANDFSAARIVLKSDVTVGATQNITGHLTIVDDGTARTIRRQGFTDKMFTIAQDASLTFTSTGADDSAPTLTIDGNMIAAAPIVDLDNGNGALTIHSGVRFTGNRGAWSGSIIRTTSGATPTIVIDGGVFDENAAVKTNGGLNGGLIQIYGGTANIQNVTFKDNAMEVSGIPGGLIYANGSQLTIKDCIFTGVTIQSSQVKGGVLYIAGGTVNVDNTTFENLSLSAETETAYGGAIYVTNGTVNVTESTFDTIAITAENNVARGGAIYADNGTVTIEDSIFRNINGAGKNGFSGGAIYANVAMTVKGSRFTDNQIIATTAGSKTYGGAIVGVANKTLTIEGCTFTRNQATNRGAISVPTNGILHLSDSIFSGNQATSEGNDIGTYGAVTLTGGVIQTELYLPSAASLTITDALEATSRIAINATSTNRTIAAFDSATALQSCKIGNYLVAMNGGYVITYDESTLTARMEKAVAQIGERQYASLSDAIVAASGTGTILQPTTLTLISGSVVSLEETITIPSGTYVEITDNGQLQALQRAETFAGTMFEVEANAGLTLTSTGTNETPLFIIDGNKEKAKDVITSSAPVVSLQANTGNYLTIEEGVVLQNHYSVESGADKGGALIYTEEGCGATVYIKGGLFLDNDAVVTETVGNAGTKGGMIYVASSCESFNIQNAIFRNNTFTTEKQTNLYGGVIYNAGVNMSLQNTDFRNNTLQATATSTSSGGVLAHYGGTLSVKNCNFDNNTTLTGSGNGWANIRLQASGKNVSMENCTFTNNTADYAGAIQPGAGTLSLKNCYFEGNTAEKASETADIRAGVTTTVSGKIVMKFYAQGVANRLKIGGALTSDSSIGIATNVTLSGEQQVATFADGAMTDVAKEVIYLTGTPAQTLFLRFADNKATTVSKVATIGEQGYASLADAITAAGGMESDEENPVVITMAADDVIKEQITIPNGSYITITDNGTQKTLTRAIEYTGTLFQVDAGGKLSLVGTTANGLVLDGNQGEASTGLLVNNQGTLCASKAKFTNNKSDAHGGAVAFDKGVGSIYDSEFTANVCTKVNGRGGAIYVGSDSSIRLNVGLYGCTFARNQCSGSGSYGGALSLVTNAEVVAENCIFAENSAVITAGSIFVSSSSSSKLILKGSIVDNTNTSASSIAPNVRVEGYAEVSGFNQISSIWIGNANRLHISGALVPRDGENPYIGLAANNTRVVGSFVSEEVYNASKSYIECITSGYTLSMTASEIKLTKN